MSLKGMKRRWQEQKRRSSELKSAYDELKGQRKQLENDIQDLKEEIDIHEKQANLLDQVSNLLQKVSVARRKEVISVIEDLSSEALQTVFKRDDYQLKLRFSSRRNSLVCEPRLITSYEDNLVETSLVEGHGGGVVDVVGFILRLICVNFLDQRNLIVLDEPFNSAHITDEQTQRLGNFVQNISHQLDMQIILISANPKLKEFSDRMFTLHLNDNHHMTEVTRG